MSPPEPDTFQPPSCAVAAEDPATPTDPTSADPAGVCARTTGSSAAHDVPTTRAREARDRPRMSRTEGGEGGAGCWAKVVVVRMRI